jgi:aspartate ammonia-lyase
MNVNEVIANRALELLGRAPGEYEWCHPNDHVNRSQSTNDVYPTALRLALLIRHRTAASEVDRLIGALRHAAERFAAIPKLARTQLRDAVPMTVGDEFAAWADSCGAAREALERARDGLTELNLGGTAVGTGLAAPARYAEHAISCLAEISGVRLRAAESAVSATTDATALLGYSAAIRTAAVSLAKLANDLRLLSSGPRTGLGELELPAVRPALR